MIQIRTRRFFLFVLSPQTSEIMKGGSYNRGGANEWEPTRPNSAFIPLAIAPVAMIANKFLIESYYIYLSSPAKHGSGGFKTRSWWKIQPICRIIGIPLGLYILGLGFRYFFGLFLSGFWMEQCTSSCFYYGCFSIIWAPYFTMTSNPWRLVWWWMGANQTIQLGLQPSGDSSLHCGSQPIFNSELLNLFCFANHVSGRFELRMRRRSWCKIQSAYNISMAGYKFRLLTMKKMAINSILSSAAKHGSRGFEPGMTTR